MTVLKKSFFENDTLHVAENLLGKFLVRANAQHEPSAESRALMITEVEAYTGPHDLACHAAKGRTPRTEVMFGEGGTWYVYFVYGIHWMLNIVTERRGYPAAVLIRGTDEVSGPARLTKHLQINNFFNAKSSNKESGLWIEDRGIVIPKNEIIRSPRIGVDYAGPIWSKKPYRFLINSKSSAQNHG